MHLAIDALGTKRGGAATILKLVLEAAIADERISQVTLFRTPRALCQFELPRSRRVIEVERSDAEPIPVGRIRWVERGLRRAVRDVDADALLSLTGMSLVRGAVPLATLVQQCLPLSREGLARSDLRERTRMRFIRRLMRETCRASDLVAVQTQTTRFAVASAYRLPLERILLVPPTIDALPRIEGTPPEVEVMKQTPEDSRLLFVGSEAPYKNIGVATRAMATVRKVRPQARLFLTWRADHPVGRLPGVTCLGYLSRPLLRSAYELATVLVMPSLIESVGLPLLEAASLGTPIVAADRPYAREVCREAAVYFDPLDDADLSRKVLEVIGDARLRRGLRERALQLAQEPSRQNAFAPLVAALQTLAK